MAFHFYQSFFLGFVIVAIILPSGSVIAEAAAVTVTPTPTPTQSEGAPDCNGLKCSLGTNFCILCCKGQGHTGGVCVKSGYYYVCQCQN